MPAEMENLNLSDNNNNEFEPYTESEEQEALLFFRTCIVDRDVDELKIKMQRTIKIREALIKKKGTLFHQTFPFYFIMPTLVCFQKVVH